MPGRSDPAGRARSLRRNLSGYQRTGSPFQRLNRRHYAAGQGNLPGLPRCKPADARAHRTPRVRRTATRHLPAMPAPQRTLAGPAYTSLNLFPLRPRRSDGLCRTQTLVRHGRAARVRFAASSPVRTRYGAFSPQRACAAACGGAPASLPRGRPFEWVRHRPVSRTLKLWR